MTEVYRIVEADGRDECILFCSKSPQQPELYVASVWYWKRESKESVPSVKHFLSTQDETNAKMKAENWIKESLGSDYRVLRYREESGCT